MDLIEALDQRLTNTFEDNIIIEFISYALPEDIAADPSQYRAIVQRYNKARAAYLRSVAELIENPDALEE